MTNPTHLDSKIPVHSVYWPDRNEFASKNVYVDLKGNIRPLPFNGGMGLWHFDGQVFYKRKIKRG